MDYRNLKFVSGERLLQMVILRFPLDRMYLLDRIRVRDVQWYGNNLPSNRSILSFDTVFVVLSPQYGHRSLLYLYLLLLSLSFFLLLWSHNLLY